MFTHWRDGLPPNWAADFEVEVRARTGVEIARFLPLPCDDWQRDRWSPIGAAAMLTPVDVAASRWLSRLSLNTATSYACHLAAVGAHLFASERFPARSLLHVVFLDPRRGEAQLAEYGALGTRKPNTLRQYLGTIVRALHCMPAYGAPRVRVPIAVPSRDQERTVEACDADVLYRTIARLRASTDRRHVRVGAELALLCAGLRPHEICSLRRQDFSSDFRFVSVGAAQVPLRDDQTRDVARWCAGLVPSELVFPVKARTLQRDLRCIGAEVGGVLTAEAVRRLCTMAAFERGGIHAAAAFARNRPDVARRVITGIAPRP